MQTRAGFFTLRSTDRCLEDRVHLKALLAYPLSEAEIDQLDDFLISDSVPEEAMDLSMMDGFITALASGPNLMMPSSM
jgi:hypothetical protein